MVSMRVPLYNPIRKNTNWGFNSLLCYFSKRQNLLKIEKDPKICKLSMTEIKENRNKSQSVKLCSKCDNYNNKVSN